MLFTAFTITCDRAQFLADSDECLIDGSCDQLCLNKEGTFDCQCVSGYEKSGQRCTAVNGMCISVANNVVFYWCH